jgi:threonine/homoserine/homoserine lactone efflux protein
MLEYIVLGAGFAFAAGVQPGPLQAFLFSQVAEKGWKRTLPASFAPILSDGPIALLVLLILKNLPPSMARVLHAAGGLLLLYFAWGSFRTWRRQRADRPVSTASAPRTLFQAALVNILNPNPYLGWSLVLGPSTLEAWGKGPSNAVALIAAFYGTMVVTLAATIVLFGTTRGLGPRGRRAILLASVVTLALLGVYQLAVALRPPA